MPISAKHSRRGQAGHQDQGHDLPVCTVRRIRAGPHLRTRTRNPRKTQGILKDAPRPKRTTWRVAPGRQGGRNPPVHCPSCFQANPISPHSNKSRCAWSLTCCFSRNVLVPRVRTAPDRCAGKRRLRRRPPPRSRPERRGGRSRARRQACDRCDARLWGRGSGGVEMRSERTCRGGLQKRRTSCSLSSWRGRRTGT